MNSNVHAVVVSFNPHSDFLEVLINGLLACVSKVWLIDNGSRDGLAGLKDLSRSMPALRVVELGRNFGVGAAQNWGINFARAEGASHVLLLDQDSQPVGNMIESLLEAWKMLQAECIPVAAVAPLCLDRSTGGRSGFVRFGCFGYKKIVASKSNNFMRTDFLISSGSLVSADVFDIVGLLDDELFIDHVDTEWCLRAQYKGYQLYGVPSAHMLHSLGRERKKIWLFRWRNVPIHSPFRYYYMFRNGVLLLRRSYVPVRWRVGEVIRFFQMFLLFGFFGRDRFRRMAMMVKGLRDGFKGVCGPMAHPHE